MEKTKPKRPRKRHIAVDDIHNFQLVADPQISPDGQNVLFAKKHVGDKNNYITNLWIVPTDKGEPRQFTSGGKDGHARWSPDGETIAFLSGREKPRPQIFTIPAAGGEATALTSLPEGSIGSLQWSPNGKQLAVSFRETEFERTDEAKKAREESGESIPARVIDDMFYRLDGDGYFNVARFALYIVDIETGTHRKLFDRDTIGWFTYDWSPNSKELVVACNTHRDALLKWWKHDLYRVDAKTGKARKLAGLPEGSKSTVKWSPDGKRIAFAGVIGKELWGVHNTRLYTCDTDGKNVRDLTGHAEYCLSATSISDTAEAVFEDVFTWSNDSRRVFMNFGWHGSTHIVSVDAKATGSNIVFHTKGRKTVSMGNFSSDGRQVALTVGDQTTLPEIAVGEFSGADGKLKIKTRTRFNAALLGELELSAPESHWIDSTDGAKVQVWLMKPPGFKPKKKYPAVLEIHGGPHAQYGEAFFHEFQVLAAAGYVVVFSNPRGSKGYGEEHCAAIRGQWGQADWDDVQAVTAFMQQQPFIDSKKMGVMGGSYGGYMTNWVIGHTHDFAGAISDRCVSNLVSMVGSSDLPLVPGEYWDGNSWDNTEAIWEQSPLKHFGNVKTPTLVIHSEGDLRCNIEQSEQVFAALKLRGIPTRLVRYPTTTSHGMSRQGPPDLRMHRLGQILEWWAKYLR